ncbi:MAG: ABC transporter substrate-binding protein [Desulfobacterales bacterium]|nr:ABC transporter substrate-binding protein [Desulfobacterales bacterium]
MKRRVTVFLGFFMTMVFALSSPVFAGEKVLPLGLHAPMSGPAASWGLNLMRGAELRAEEINNAGGVKVGADIYKIKIIGYDNNYTASGGTTAANKLVYEDKVKYIVSIGKDEMKQTKPTAKSLGYEVVAEEYYNRGTTDFFPLLTKIMAEKPDMIDIDAAPMGEGGLIWKQLYELGFRGVKLWLTGSNAAALVKIAGKEASEEVVMSLEGDYDGVYATATQKKASKKFREKHGEPMNFITGAAYDAVWFLEQAITKAKSLDTTKVRNTMEKMKFKSLAGEAVMGGEKTYGIKHQFLYPVVITAVKDGKSTPVARLKPLEIQ